MSQINSAVAMFLKQKISYVACFVPLGHTSSELPRIMIQFQPWDNGIPTYEALEESLKRDVKAAIGEVKKETGLPIRSVELGQIALDRKENRIVMRMQAAVRGEGTVQALSIGMLGKSGVVFLHCYATSERFTRTVPLFEVFADSFKFAPGQAYDPAEATVTSIPRQESRARSFSWFGALRGGLVRWIDRRRDRRARSCRPRLAPPLRLIHFAPIGNCSGTMTALPERTACLAI